MPDGSATKVRRVVVADDDRDIVDLLTFNLEAAGYEVLTAGDGEAALELVRSSRPDVVVLDVMMPKLDGLDVLAALRADAPTKTIPVVMLTAKTSDDDHMQGWDAGADYYLTKPFDLEELLRFIDHLQVPRIRSVNAHAAFDLHDEVVVAALHELRGTRKERRLGDWNVIDALYRAYVAAVVGGVGVTMLSGVVGDERIEGAALRTLEDRGAAVVGLVVAVALAMGLRSGSRGGPIALEAAEVRHVLLAPVDRDVALRAPAQRQLRFAAFVGMVVGAVVGLLAFRRLPARRSSGSGRARSSARRQLWP